jgi:hypothetical protein
MSDYVQTQKKCDGDPHNDLTSIWGRKHEPYTEGPNSLRLKKVRHVKSKVKSMLIILFQMKGNVYKNNSTWQAKQSVPHTTVAFYGGGVKTCENFTAPSHTSLFTRKFLEEKEETLISHSLLFPVSQIGDKAERPLF